MRFPLTSSISFLALALSFVHARPQPFGSSQDLEDSQFEKRASNWAHFGDKTYNNGKIVRGVNLGSWFVLENWMVPSFFLADDIKNQNVPDEYNYMKIVSGLTSRDDAKNRMKQHWATWITESDFAAIKAAGLNTVRLPVGYWTYNLTSSEPYTTAARPYIRQALTWAKKYNLDVVMDLHGAPGSQNGADNSGIAGPIGFGKSPSDIPRTIDSLVKMVQWYVNDPTYGGVVKAIELMNEPRISKYTSGGINQGLLLSFYQQAYKAVRAAMDPKAITRPTVFMSDAFTPLWDTAGTNQVIPSSSFSKASIAQDTHYYEAFGDLAKLSHDQHIDSVCSLNTQLQGQSNNRPVVVGEWSIGTGIGCTPYQDCQSFTMQDSINSFNTAEGNVFLRRFFEAQASTFEKNAGGWIFWSWKTESASDWSYKDALAQGWIPKDVSKPSSWAFVPSTNRSSCVSPAASPNQKLTFATQTSTTASANSPANPNAKTITPNAANGGYSTEEESSSS